MANETRVGKPGASGGIFSAVEGSALPVDAVATLDVAFASLGKVGDGGLVETPSRDVSDVNDWNGDLARRIQTSASKTFTFTLIERKENVLKEIAGQDNVTTTVDGTSGVTTRAIKNTLEELPVRSYIADMVDRGVKIRKVIPHGQITEVGDIGYVNDDVIKFEVTLTAYKDTNSVYDYDYEAIPA